MKLRLCHSMWPAPAIKKRWNVDKQLEANIWLYAVSVAFAKRTGAEIVLHTNNEGKELLGFLPYDEIHTTLEGLDINPRIWAAGKIYAQEAEPLGSIHIDGDVFVKRPYTIDIDEFAKSDLIYQHHEIAGDIYIGNLDLVSKALKKAGSELYGLLDVKRMTACNCGVIGFNSRELKNLYIEGYKKMYEILLNDEEAMKIIDSPVEICPDLVMEQYWLESLIKNTRAKPYVLLNANRLYEHANEIHFTHVIGHNKYEEKNRRAIKSLLKELNTDIYHQVQELWP